MSLGIQKYTDKSIVIRGDTKARLGEIKAISGAKFGYYGGKPGWMFPVTMESQVRRALNIPGSNYVDGPKPNPRSGPYEPRASTGPSTGSSDVESLLMPRASATKPPVRGGLRGKAPEDPEESEQKSEQELIELKATVAQLKGENQSILQQLAHLQEKFDNLSAKFDSLTVEETLVSE